MTKRRVRSWLTESPPVGAAIGTPGRAAEHMGVYIGAYGPFERAVAHNRKGQRVLVEPIEVFAPSGYFWVARRAPRGHEATIVGRMLWLAQAGRRYDLWAYNCEHAVSWAFTGVPRSPQLDETLRFAATLGTFALMIHALSADA